MQLANQLKFHVRRIPWFKKALKKALRIRAVNDQIASLERKLIYQYIASLNQRVEALEGKSVLKALDFGTWPTPSFAKPVSQAVTCEQMLSPEYAEWCDRLHIEPNFHRKSWEYLYILRALEQAGKLRPGMKGVGFGVGKDPIVAYMVKQGCDLIATDLDPASAHEKGWAQSNQYSEKLLNLNEYGVCSDRALKKHVALRNVNMNEIPGELRKGQFDFTWSACAYEHLGSIENGIQFVLNSLECLKPGGIAVHTTEFNISSNEETLTFGGTVLFRQKDFVEMGERVRKAGGKMELNFNLGTQPMDRFYDVPPYSEFNHLRLQLDQYLTTSFGVIITK